MSTIDSFLTREAGDFGWISEDEMKGICPDCAESMVKKGISRVSVQAMFEQIDAQGGGKGNIKELIKHWKKEQHPFGACKKWVSEHRGEADYPAVKDPDKFCGKLKHMVED